jgi:hypothetical protein
MRSDTRALTNLYLLSVWPERYSTTHQGSRRKRIKIMQHVNLKLSVESIETHHRDTEDTEEAQRFEYLSILCVISVRSVSLW